MITVRNLVKRFDTRELFSRISFQVDEGDLVGLLGGSGSGKSTLLRCVTLKDKWDQGQYIYEGNDITDTNLWQKLKLRKNWAYLGDKPALDGKKSALANVLSGRFYHTPLWRLITKRVAMDEHMLAMDFLEKVGLLDKAEELAEKLSGGEQQRVALARALVKGAKFIVADEPVTGLDPESANRVMQDLRSICDKQRVTIICAINQVELAEKYATRIWGLADGKIVVDIPARRLTQREKQLIF